MRIAVTTSRIVMGLPLFVFGLNAFLRFLPLPNEILPDEGGFSEPAFTLLNQLWDSGFVMHSACLAHVLCGSALLTNPFVPLALAVHLPVTLQMVLFHLVLEPATGAMAYAMLAMNLFLICAHRKAYRELLKPRCGIS